MNFLWHWEASVTLIVKWQKFYWEQQCSTQLSDVICVWEEDKEGKEKRDKMEDQLLIRNRAFPFYLCAIKQMFIFEPMKPTELIC